MREEFPGFEQRSIYYLLMVICPTGSLDPASLKFQAMQKSTKSYAPCAVDLWVMSAFRGVEWGDFKDEWLDMSGDDSYNTFGQSFDSDADARIPSLERAEFVKLCLKTFGQVGRESKQRWELTAGVLDKEGTGLVEWSELLSLVEGLSLEWRKASRVLDILATAARVRVSLQGLFRYIDADGDGVVSHHDFHSKVDELVGMELDSEEKDSIWEALDAKSDGSVSLSEAIAALDVVDTWVAAPANDFIKVADVNYSRGLAFSFTSLLPVGFT